jgi:hypothetical protein
VSTTIGVGRNFVGATAPAGSVVFGKRGLSHPFWTTKLAATAPLASTSASLVSSLVRQFNAATDNSTPPLKSYYGAPYQTVTDQTDQSQPTYEVPLNQPRVKVWARRDQSYVDGGGTTIHLRDQLLSVPIPDRTLLNKKTDGSLGDIEPSGSDHAVIIICGYEAWEFWIFGAAVAGTDPAGYNWKCEQGGYMADIRYHPGWWSGSGGANNPVGGDFGLSATGGSYLGCILTSVDFVSADINHPMAVGLPLTGIPGGGFTQSLYPATREDTYNGFVSTNAQADPYRVPEGARFRLPAATWTDAYITNYASTRGQTDHTYGTDPGTLAKILRCLRDYGVIIFDSAGVIAFAAEGDQTAGTPYNPQSTAPAWGNFGQTLPWSSFVQVVAPTVQFATPGAGPTTAQPNAYDFSLAT